MVSVIIPLYNRVDLISFSLRSIEVSRLTTSDLEVILVDDGSTDGGPAYVESNFPWVKLIRNSVNKGAPACRNQGLELASGEFVLFLDSDDLLENDFFKTKLEALDQFSDVAGVYGPWDYFESEDHFKDECVRPRSRRYPLFNSSQKDQIVVNLLWGWFIHPAAIIWRTSAVRNIGGYDVNLIVNQDVDFCFRMLLTHSIAGVDSPRALIRIHKGERVGQIRSDNKLIQVLNLRIQFIETLEKLNILAWEHNKAVAQYSFDLWRAYRNTYPETSNELLLFSKKCNPYLRLRGSWPIRLLGFLVGPANAISVKDWIRRPHFANNCYLI